MVDRETFDLRLRSLDQRLTALREIAAAGRQRFLADAHLQAEAERHLQVAIQAAIDAGHQVLVEHFGDTPHTYREVFEHLGRRGVLATPLAARLALAAGLRNILVHAYLEVDPERIWASLSRLDDLAELASSLTNWLERTETGA